MYRTFISLFVVIGITHLFVLGLDKFQWIQNIKYIVILGTLILIYAFSYRKQTKYISKRIKSNLDEQ